MKESDVRHMYYLGDARNAGIYRGYIGIMEREWKLLHYNREYGK